MFFGVTNLVEGLAAVGNPRFFVTHPRPVVGDLAPWGFVMHQYVPGSLAIRGWMGVIAGLAGVAVGVGVLCKSQLSRWIGVALLGLEAFGQLPRMRGDRLVSASIFTLGIIALSALIGYGKRIRQPHITVLSSQGSVDAEVLSGSMRRDPSPPRGSEINRLRWSRERDGRTPNMDCLAARRAERNARMERVAGGRPSQCDGSLPPLRLDTRRRSTGRDRA